LGIGDWGLGIGPNPQSPIPNPQSPIPSSLIIWNLLDWALVKIINKANVNKPVGNFIVISTRSEERYIVVSNTNGNLFLVDLSKKEVAIQKLDEKVND
jgi:hypothetical protein